MNQSPEHIARIFQHTLSWIASQRTATKALHGQRPDPKTNVQYPSSLQLQLKKNPGYHIERMHIWWL